MKGGRRKRLYFNLTGDTLGETRARCACSGNTCVQTGVKRCTADAPTTGSERAVILFLISLTSALLRPLSVPLTGSSSCNNPSFLPSPSPSSSPSLSSSPSPPSFFSFLFFPFLPLPLPLPLALPFPLTLFFFFCQPSSSKLSVRPCTSVELKKENC